MVQGKCRCGREPYPAVMAVPPYAKGMFCPGCRRLALQCPCPPLKEAQ